MGWFNNLSKTMQGIIAVVTIVVVTASATAATVRFVALPDALRNIDSQHTARLDRIETRHTDFEHVTDDKLDAILENVKSLDLRLCLEQAKRDDTDARRCAQPISPPN